MTRLNVLAVSIKLTSACVALMCGILTSLVFNVFFPGKKWIIGAAFGVGCTTLFVFLVVTFYVFVAGEAMITSPKPLVSLFSLLAIETGTLRSSP